MKRPLSLIVGTLFFLLSTAMPLIAVAQDIVSIKKGSFVFDNSTGGGTVDIHGNHGFAMRAGVHEAGGRFGLENACTGEECVPGATFEIDAAWSGLDVHVFTATIRGETYQGSGAESPFSAEIGFNGMVTMPPMSSEPTDVQVPFEFAGAVQYLTSEGYSRRALLAGGGVVTFTLQWDDLDQNWKLARAVFEFQKL